MITWRDILQGPREPSPLVRQAPREPPASPPPSSILPVVLSVGLTIWWHSPLFGAVHGLVALPPDQGMVCVSEHSVTGGTVWIPLEWVTSVEEPLDGKKET